MDAELWLAFLVTFPPASGTDIHVSADEKGWNQQWAVIAHKAILKNEDGTPNQSWEAHFVDRLYDFALVPGFPGSVDSNNSVYRLR
jgi:hypothetical protein